MKRVYLDYVGALTYDTTRGYTTRHKEGLKDFLEFLVSNFEVLWCSTLEELYIKGRLLSQGIDESILSRIGSFSIDATRIKTSQILEADRNFILIDADANKSEENYFKQNLPEAIFIKTDNKDSGDLKRIREVLEKYI